MRRSFLRQCDFVPARPFGTLGDSQPALQGLPAPGPARPARARTRSGDSESWCSEWAVPSSKCWYHWLLSLQAVPVLSRLGQYRGIFKQFH
jgi:hypothetical protein